MAHLNQKTIAGGVHRIPFLGLSPTNLENTYSPGAGVSMGGRNNPAVRAALARRASLGRGTMQVPKHGSCIAGCGNRGEIIVSYYIPAGPCCATFSCNKIFKSLYVTKNLHNGKYYVQGEVNFSKCGGTGTCSVPRSEVSVQNETCDSGQGQRAMLIWTPSPPSTSCMFSWGGTNHLNIKV